MDQEPITVTVVLRLSDPQGAKALEEEVSTPTSLNYHKTITVSEFTSRFGPSQETWNAVLAYLEQNGLTLSHSTIDRMTMSVTGTRAQVQKAFHVIIDDYQLRDRTFHAVATDPVMPAAIAPMIATVAGLSNLARPHPSFTPYPLVPASFATAYNGTLTPSGTTNTGGLPPGLDGSGVTIGLLEDDGFDLYDVSNWLNNAHLPANLVNHIHVYSAVSP
jgi:subtilase family serine protease